MSQETVIFVATRARPPSSASHRPPRLHPSSVESSTTALACSKNADIDTNVAHAVAHIQPAAAQSNKPRSSGQRLGAHTPLSEHTPSTPIDTDYFENELAQHPDKEFVQHLLHGLRNGFEIGFEGERFSVLSPNLPSALEHPDVVSAHLASECSRGHTAGPYPAPPCSPLRTSGIGVVEKKSGGHRLIVHLSAPAGTSVNDGIDGDQFRLAYITVDDIIKHVVRHGKGALVYKVDVKHAFRNIPVRQCDWPLLGMYWNGMYYVDKVLPFGLRSSPAIFNKVADGVQWVLRNAYGLDTLEHYLDDFVGVGPPSHTITTSRAAIQKATLLQVFANLGLPVAEGEDKNVGPATVVTVLGIEIDTVAQEIRLPAPKLHALLSALSVWQTRKCCTKRELLSLIGSLSFAAKVVPPGRTFVRRLIDCSMTGSHLSSTIEIDADTREDIAWWHDFAISWNGRSFFHASTWIRSPDAHLFTDASGVGYGGFYQGHWFFGRWPLEFESADLKNIMVRELVPIALACWTWGSQWKQLKIVFHCDNHAAVDAWSKGSCRNRKAMAVIRSILAAAAKHNFIVYLRHIAGVRNDIADSLSRLQIQQFHRLVMDADQEPTPHMTPTALFSKPQPTD